MSEATFAKLDDWIARDSISFSLDSPTSLNGAVDQVLAALGSTVELLGLGEAMHGGEEFLTLRNRMFERLVAAHGFTAIAIESSFPRGRWVNEYIAGSPDIANYEAVEERGFSHNFGKLATSRELVEWMRQYNATRDERAKTRFYGFDSPTEMTHSDTPRHLLAFALDFLADVDCPNVEQSRSHIEVLLGNDAAWENPEANWDAAKSIGLSPNATALRIATEDLIAMFQTNRPEYVTKSSPDRFAEAFRHATHARQMLNYHATAARPSENRMSDLLGQRDAMMAENLAYILRRERRRGGRVLVFAHNAHLKRGLAEWIWGTNHWRWWPAGAQASAMLRQKYAVIGTLVGASEPNGVGVPEPGTLEARLMSSPAGSCFIPTHAGRHLQEAELAAMPIRAGSQRNTGYFPSTPKTFTDFDWLVMLNTVSSGRGGPQLPG
jgi:erythromycin esterase